MKTQRTITATAAATALALCASTGAQALDVHNSYGSYTVSIFDAQSTAFNSVHSTNGNENQLCCFGRNQTDTAPDDHLLVKFVADPGYVFTSMSMGFTGFSLRTNSHGYITYHGDWNVSTGTFAPGSDSWRYDFIADHLGWDQTGTSGTFFRVNQFWNSGGVHSFLPIMSGAGINFANAPEFTLEMNIGGAADGWFGTYLSVSAETTFAPVAAPVPEPETYAMLLAGLGLLGFVTRRRKQKAA